MTTDILARIDIDRRVASSLADALEKGKIDRLDTIAYLTYYDSIANDASLVRSFIVAIAHERSIFADLENLISGEESRDQDISETERLRALIQQS